MGTHRPRGVTLVEVLVGLGVVGILVSLLVPAVQDVRRAAARVDCQNRMRQIALGLHAFHDDTGRLPGVVDVFADPSIYTRPGIGQALCWPAKILPYVGETALGDATTTALRQTANPFADPPHVGLGTAVKVYGCPADPRVVGPVTEPGGKRVGLISYMGVRGSNEKTRWNGFEWVQPKRPPGGMFDARGVRFTAVADGLSQTLLLGERPPDPAFESGWWYVPNSRTLLPYQPVLWAAEYGGIGSGCSPNGTYFDEEDGWVKMAFVFGPGRFDNPCDGYHFWSPHGGGANLAFADGSIRFLTYKAGPMMRDLATRAGGEIVELP